MAYGDITGYIDKYADGMWGPSALCKVNDSIYAFASGNADQPDTMGLRTFAANSVTGAITKAIIATYDYRDTQYGGPCDITKISNDVFMLVYRDQDVPWSSHVKTVSISSDGATITLLDSSSEVVGIGYYPRINKALQVGTNVWAYASAENYDDGGNKEGMTVRTRTVNPTTGVLGNVTVKHFELGWSPTYFQFVALGGTYYALLVGQRASGTHDCVLKTFTIGTDGTVSDFVDTETIIAGGGTNSRPVIQALGYNNEFAIFYHDPANNASVQTRQIISGVIGAAQANIIFDASSSFTFGAVPAWVTYQDINNIKISIVYQGANDNLWAATVNINHDATTITVASGPTAISGTGAPYGQCSAKEAATMSDGFYMVGATYGSGQVVLFTFGVVTGPVITGAALILELAYNQSIFTEVPTWTDVTAEMMALHTERGRMHELDRVEAGTAIFTLNNVTGNWWRNNSSSPYYPYVKPLTLVRLNPYYALTSYHAFYGVVEAIKPNWVDERGGKTPIADLQCVDIFKSFSRLNLMPAGGNSTGQIGLYSTANAGTTEVFLDNVRFLYPGQSVCLHTAAASTNEIGYISSVDQSLSKITLSGAIGNTFLDTGYLTKFPRMYSGIRINDVLYELGWPMALTTTATGLVEVAEMLPPIEGTNALEHLQDVAQAESGLLFVRGDGYVVFQAQDYRQSLASQATFEDSTAVSTSKYVKPELSDDDSFIYNWAEIGGDDINTQIFASASSAAMQGKRSYTITNGVYAYDKDALDKAYLTVRRYEDSLLRCESLLIFPDATASDLYPKVFGYELSTKITFNLNSTANPANISQDYHIEKITHDWNASDDLWQTKWQLWQVNQFQIFRADGTTGHSAYYDAYSDVDYATAHNAAAAGNVFNENAMRVGHEYTAGVPGYMFYRGVCGWDTTTLSATTTIVSAEVLVLDCTATVVQSLDNTTSLYIVPAPTTEIAYGSSNRVIGDYGDLLDNVTDYGHVALNTPSTWIFGGWNSIALNSVGRAAINAGGITQFGFRTNRDINAVSTSGPANINEFIRVHGSSVTTSGSPRLIVRVA